MALAFEQNLEFFIVSSSMVGIGIAVALYSFIIPQLKDLFQAQTTKILSEYENLLQETKVYSNGVKHGKMDRNLLEKITESHDKIEQEGKIKFHLGLGFLFTGVSFSVSTIFPLLNLLLREDTIIEQLARSTGGLFLVIGTMLLIYVWIMSYVDLNNLMKENLKTALDNAQVKMQEVNKLKK